MNSKCLTRQISGFLIASGLVAAPSFAVQAADLGRSRLASPNDWRSTPATPSQRNFYVRGDVGVARSSKGGFSQDDLANNGGSFISESIGDTVMIGAGIGVQFNRHVRLDLTGEYRSTAQIRGLDNVTAEITDPDGRLQANTLYQGNLASYVGLLNGYVDLFNWRGFTPYVGAGVGFAHHKMSGFVTSSSATFIDALTGAQSVQLSHGTAKSESDTKFAWALMVGTSYDLSPNAKLDLGYRYVDLGSGVAAATGLIDCVCGPVAQPFRISDLNTQEFRLGIRWMLGETPQQEYRSLK